MPPINLRDPRRLSVFATMPRESSTDQLLLALMNKLDAGFSNLNANLRSIASAQTAQIPLENSSNSAPRPINSGRNLNVPNSGPPQFELPQNVAARSSNHQHPSNANHSSAPPQFENYRSDFPPENLSSAPRRNQNSNVPDDSDPISRLERMVSGLSTQVQSLSERVSSNSNASYPSVPPGSPHRFFTNPYYYRVYPDKWKIRYDGNNEKTSIEFFLDQVESLTKLNGLNWDIVIPQLPQLLEGSVANWLLRYQKKHNYNISWEQLKVDMIIEYRGSETEESLWCKLANRKQGEKETFDKYYNALLDMQDRVSRSFSDEEIIGILRQNVKFEIKKCLVTYQTNNLTDFVNKCRLTDRLLFPQHQNVSNASTTRKVSEIESGLPAKNCDPEIEAFTPRKPQNFTPSANLKCWNCDLVGHSFDICTEQRKWFCYKCGHKNVTCLTCPKCGPNFRHRQPQTEPPPSAPQDLSQTP